MLPFAFDADLVHLHHRWLVDDVGPRPFRSAAETAAVVGVTERLRAAGWQVQALGRSPVACRGAGTTLFLAHLDTVPGSPGAIDNAGSVAVLLELARTSEAPDLCLGFPVGEEVGLVGSHQMAEAWSKVRPAWPELVVALEFAGDGVPTAIDLTENWGTGAIDWLRDRAPNLDIPYLHRAFGRALPQYRSDHRAFAVQGVPAFLLMGRSASGVFECYHQPSDTTAVSRDLAATAAVLEGLALGDSVPQSGRGPAFLFFGLLVPGWLTWGLLGAGAVSAARDWRRLVPTLRSLGPALLATLVAALVMYGVQWLGFESETAEQTAAVVMGVAPTGWWAAAPMAVALGWLGWAAVRWRFPGRGASAPLAAGLLAIAGTALDPLVGLPFAIAALMGRLHPLLAVLPALILLRPGPLRELSFHGLLDPALWGVLFLLAWPATCAHVQSKSMAAPR